MDEQWSFVGNKSNQRWIWYAVEHSTNTILAYVFGKRKDVVFKELQTLLKPFNIKRYYIPMIGVLMNEIYPLMNMKLARVTHKKLNEKT